MVTLKQLKKAVEDLYLIVDPHVIDVILAAAISNRLPISDKPVWLLLIGPSSGGKTIFVQLLDDIPWTTPIDTLTSSTFASAFRSASGKEPSLLHQANNGVLVFKDFTTLTSMNEDGLREIMGQLRAIYDGTFHKKAGNTVNVDWKGKIGIVAAGTVAVQRKMRQYSEQGERFLNYSMKIPDRQAQTRKTLDIQKGLKAKEAELRAMTAEYIQSVLEVAAKTDIEIADEFKDRITRVSDFSTLARSPVILNKKTGKVEWVPEAEMPARMATMMVNIGQTLGIMDDENRDKGIISAFNMEAVYKIALDSIPAERRLCLKMLASYDFARTKSLAIKLSYPTETVNSWLYQLAALKMVTREPGVGNLGDKWTIKPQYRRVLREFDDIQPTHAELVVTEEEETLFMEGEENDENDKELLDNVDWGDFA